MPDTQQPAPTVPDEAEDSELVDLSAVGSLDEAQVRKLLLENPEAAADLILGQMKKQSESYGKLIQREQRRTMNEYRETLQDEFPYAPKDLISGTTKREMRRSAERLHKANESIVAAAVAKAVPQPTTTPSAAAAAPAASAAAADPRAAAWGAPPAAATEIVSSGSVRPWDDVSRQALSARGPRGGDTKTAVMDEIKANGPRAVQRDTFSMIASRKAPAEAKPS